MRIVLVLFILMLVTMTACAPAVTAPAPTTAPVMQATAPQTDAMPTSTLETAMPTAIMPTTVPNSANASAETVSQPAWFALPLVNARTGQTFTLADFSGQAILVRAMAEWCTNCRAGQGVWRDQVLTQVDTSRVVVVSLDVETNNSAESLAAYADNNGFPWIFAVMSPDLLNALVQQFGNTVAAPPAEPQFLIRPDGSIVGLLTDHSAQTLISLINDANA